MEGKGRQENEASTAESRRCNGNQADRGCCCNFQHLSIVNIVKLNNVNCSISYGFRQYVIFMIFIFK